MDRTLQPLHEICGNRVNIIVKNCKLTLYSKQSRSINACGQHCGSLLSVFLPHVQLDGIRGIGWTGYPCSVGHCSIHTAVGHVIHVDTVTEDEEPITASFRITTVEKE